MNPTFTIKHKKCSNHQLGFALRLSDSVSSCLESALSYSCNLFSNQTCLTLQKYHSQTKSLVIFQITR